MKRCSDDGEPSQTAGKPILGVLEGAGVTKVCAIVTRYFGGTLLGTGGLVRAYSGAVQAGLSESTVLTVKPARKAAVTTDYNGVGKIQYMLGTEGLTTLDSQYTDSVKLTVLVPDSFVEQFAAEVTELTSGRAAVEYLDEVYFGVLNKEVLLF